MIPYPASIHLAVIKPVFSDPSSPQQRKLNAFVKEYNELRPHEALAMRTPAALHKISEVKYPEKIREFFLGYADMKELKVYDIMNYKNELKL